MEIEEAKKQCESFIRYLKTDLRDESNEDNFLLLEAIETVLQELENSVSNKELINYTNVALTNAKSYNREGNKIKALEEYKRYKNLKDLLDFKVYKKRIRWKK